MAEITPVTREEFYLAKAGGQDVPVPSAVTREEHYLEKLSNDSVVVPSPVTRREKFLYFACGGDVTLPSEDKMTRLERLIAKAGGMDVATPTAVTRLEKFWTNVEGGGWKVTELTGTLPMTFKADGTALINYRIYGTADGAGERTKNIFEIIPSDQIITETGTLTFATDAESGTLTANGTTGNAEASVKQRFIVTPEIAGRYYFSASFGQESPFNTYRAYMYNIGRGWTTKWDGTTRSPIIIGDEYQEVLLVEGYLAEVTFSVFGSKTVDNIVCRPMLRKADSTPDFIPYGYELPLTITNGTENKTSDIFIGDSKLGASDYVDYETQTITRGGISEPAPFPLPEISTYKGTNTLDSMETVGEVTIKGRIKEAE